MAGTKREIPTSKEISELPRWAIVAFAARCARRVQPVFELAWPDASEEHKEAVANAIETAEMAACSRNSSIGGAAAAAYAARVAAQGNEFPFAARAAYAGEAVEAAEAARAAAEAATEAGAAAAIAAHVAAVAAAIAASVVHAGGKSIRGDFVKLKKVARTENWRDSTPVPPEFFGPMWPHGEPDWLASIARGKPKSRDREPMSLYFDREEFSNREIAEIISMLSELYHGVSGDRLVIDKTIQFTLVGELVPEGV